MTLPSHLWGAHAPRVLATEPPPSRTFSAIGTSKACFGEAPKPTREARVLPR